MDPLAGLAKDYRDRAAALRERSQRTRAGRRVLLEAARSWDDLAERCEAELAASCELRAVVGL